MGTVSNLERHCTRLTGAYCADPRVLATSMTGTIDRDYCFLSVDPNERNIKYVLMLIRCLTIWHRFLRNFMSSIEPYKNRDIFFPSTNRIVWFLILRFHIKPSWKYLQDLISYKKIYWELVLIFWMGVSGEMRRCVKEPRMVNDGNRRSVSWKVYHRRPNYASWE